MKIFYSKIKYLFFVLLLLSFPKINGDDYFSKNSNQESQIVVESNIQKSDIENSIFYAEGNVIITSSSNEFIAKANKAIIYKSTGKIKLIGDAEVSTGEFNKVRSGEIIYFLKENKFEAISDLKQRVKTILFFNENNTNRSIER